MKQHNERPYWIKVQWNGDDAQVYSFQSPAELEAFEMGLTAGDVARRPTVVDRWQAGDGNARPHPFHCDRCGAVLRTSTPTRMDDVPGNMHVKRAVEVAIAGRHSIALIAAGGNVGNAQVLARVAAEHGAAAAFVSQRCPCGNYGRQRALCTCTMEMIEDHQAGEAYQIATNADIVVDAPRPSRNQILAYIGGRYSEPDEVVLERVKAASAVEVDDQVTKKAARTLLAHAVDGGHMDADRLPRAKAVAKTIARLAGETTVQAAHVAEALQYCIYRMD